MKRYLVFCYTEFEGSGGLLDLIHETNDYDEAKDMVSKCKFSGFFDAAQIFDTENDTVEVFYALGKHEVLSIDEIMRRNKRLLK